MFNPISGNGNLQPSSPNPQSITVGSTVVYDFHNILYEQVHSIYSYYNFGNISNDTLMNLELWNAFKYNDLTLDDISYQNLSGIEFLNRDLSTVDIPTEIKKLESELFTIRASADGDSSNDGEIVLSIGDEIVRIGVSVSRSVLFDFDINTVNNVKEYYVFNTRIIPSLNNTEQRLARIDIPRVRYEYFYTLSDNEKRSLDAILYANNTNFSIPIYTQKKKVNSIVNDIVKVDITNTCIQVGIDVLIKDIYSKEVIKVAEIIDQNTIRLAGNLINIYTSPVIIPCFSGKLPASNNKLQQTKNLSEYTITFDKNIDDINTLITNNNIQFNKYKDLYILEEQNTTDLLNYTFNKDILVNDNGFSKKDETIYNNVATITFNYSNYAEDKNEISKAKNLFNYQKGMFNDLYSRSFTNNIKLVENITAGAIIIVVENNNLTNYYQKNKIKQIYFKYNNNVEKIIGITEISVIDQYKEAIILETGFDVDIKVEDMISSDFVYKGRLNDDVLMIDYENFSFARYNLPFYKSNDVE